MFDDVGNVEDGAVVGGDFCIVGQEEMSTRAAFDLRFAEVAGVAVDRHDHLAAVVGEYCIFLCGEVVKNWLVCARVSLVGLADWEQ